MEKDLFYTITKLINSLDANGNKPELFFVDGNRSSGKTTGFYKYLVKRFKNYGEKFMLIYRYQNELKGCSEQFFANIGPLFFPNDDCTEVKRQDGAFYELLINSQSAGYAVALNSSDKLKKLSHFFKDVTRMYFDEFQAKRYLPDEVNLLINLHTSVARGKNQPVRYVPVFLTSNHVSSLNPYYKALGVANIIDNMSQGVYKGDGFVIEKNMNNEVADLQRNSAFMRAFAGSKEVKHTIENISVMDNYNFIERLKVRQFKYICNIRVDNEMICLKRVFDIPGVMFYFDNNVDVNLKARFAISTVDHDTDTLLVGNSLLLVMKCKEMFERGEVRFSDLETKEKAFEFLTLTW